MILGLNHFMITLHTSLNVVVYCFAANNNAIVIQQNLERSDNLSFTSWKINTLNGSESL